MHEFKNWEVTGEELNKAFQVFRKANKPDDYYIWLVSKFQKLTGTSSFIMDKYCVTEMQYHRIKGMAGEHGYAYTKALLAKTEGLV